jgi:hypothetical protein
MLSVSGNDGILSAGQCPNGNVLSKLTLATI